MSCRPSLPAFKRGDTFYLACVYKEAGVPTDVTAYNIRSQVRTSTGTLVAELTATKGDQVASPGGFTLREDDTQDWPIDTLIADIEVTVAGVVRSTSTFQVPVEEDVTHG